MEPRGFDTKKDYIREKAKQLVLCDWENGARLENVPRRHVPLEPGVVVRITSLKHSELPELPFYLTSSVVKLYFFLVGSPY